MSALPVLSLVQARQLQLAAQDLLTPLPRRASPADLLAAVERMQLLQIDTIAVVARSPYLVLYSRIGAFAQEWLEQALAQASLIETWAHEACFAPVHSYPLHRAHQDSRRHWAQRMAQRQLEADGAAITALVTRIAEQGAVRSSDFSRTDAGGGGWWGWKPEKRWLEAAFADGRLMVARRENFQRVYDIPQRVLAGRPELLQVPRPEATALRQQLIEASLLALGIAPARWLADYFRLDSRVSDEELQPLLRSGQALAVQVQGLTGPCYVHQRHALALEQVQMGLLQARRTVPLSPFDPLVWDRQRAQELFGFEYRLECYTPAHKRQFGYFVLPLLDRDQLVGRMDAKAHRAAGVFEVKALYLQPGVRPSTALARRLLQAISASARWHGTAQVQLGDTHPVELGTLMRALL